VLASEFKKSCTRQDLTFENEIVHLGSGLSVGFPSRLLSLVMSIRIIAIITS